MQDRKTDLLAVTLTVHPFGAHNQLNLAKPAAWGRSQRHAVFAVGFNRKSVIKTHPAAVLAGVLKYSGQVAQIRNVNPREIRKPGKQAFIVTHIQHRFTFFSVFVKAPIRGYTDTERIVMEKKTINAGRPRISTREPGSASRFFLPVLAAGTLLLALSCDLFTSKDPFPPEYYTANFISAYGFNAFLPSAEVPDPFDPAAPVVTRRWDIDYRYTGWDAPHRYDYLTFDDTGLTASDIGSTLLPGLPADTPVYRLEIVNLVQDADFESDEGGDWTFSDPAKTSVVRDDSANRIGGDWSMRLSAESSSWIDFETRLRGGFALLEGNAYRYRYRILPDLPTRIITGDNTQEVTNPGAGIPFVRVTGQFSQNATGILSLRFAPAEDSFGSVYFDDLRLTRQGGMSLVLRLRPVETWPQMEQGVYSFSVWVHSDPTVNSAGEPYAIDTFVLTMRPVAPASFAVTSARYQPAAGWQLLSSAMTGKAIQFDGAFAPVIELTLDFNESLPGRVLLAHPVLRFHPDGL